MSVNKVILIGNVGQDPKVTYYDSGSCVAQASLATTEKGYTLTTGCDIPVTTRPEQVDVFMDAAREYSRNCHL